MRSQWRRAAVVFTLAFACTATPVALPRSGTLPRCEFAGLGAKVGPTAAGPALGRFWVREIDSDELAWVDPVTLGRVSGRSDPVPQTDVSAVSPSGRLVAVYSHGVSIIDTRTLAEGATIRSRRGRAPHVLGWLSDHVLAGITDRRAILWDDSGDMVRAFGFGGEVRIVAWRSATDRLIALITTHAAGGRGAGRLIVITKMGMDVIDLGGVTAGYDASLGEHGTLLTPGLAYDPVGHRVFVVQPDGPIAEVALDDGTVGYHDPTTSLVGAFSDAMLPSASAKLVAWSDRQAIWLGSGIVAVSGSDGDALGDRSDPTGVLLVDTRDWSMCVLDDRATNIALTGGVLLAWGGPSYRELGGVGLLGWRLDDGVG